MARQAIDVAALDTTELSVAVVAVTMCASPGAVAGFRSAGVSRHKPPPADVARRLIEDTLGTDLEQWLGASPPDGEHVLYLVDALRARCSAAPEVQQCLTDIVERDPGVQRSLRVLGDSCRARAQRDAALHVYLAWLTVARASQDPAGESDSLHRLGRLYQDMGAYAEAVRCHRRRRTIHVAAGEETLAAEVLIDLGLLHIDREQFAPAAHCFERAAVELQARRPLSAVRAHIGIAEVRRRQGRREEALAVLSQCREVVGEESESDVSELLRRELAFLYEEEGWLEEAADLHVRRRRGSVLPAARAASVGSSRQLARIRLLQNRPREAATHYLESIAADSDVTALGVHLSMTAEDADAAAAALRLVTSGDGPSADSTAQREAIATLARPLFRVRRGSGYAVA